MIKDEALAAAWQQVATEILQRVVAMVNSPATMGTEYETGCIMMFFNKRNHNGKSTLLAYDVGPQDLERLLKFAVANINRAQIIEPEKLQ